MANSQKICKYTKSKDNFSSTGITVSFADQTTDGRDGHSRPLTTTSDTTNS